MRCNILTWVVLFIIIAFIVYVYTSKLPIEQYMEEYGDLEHFLSIAQGNDSDSDSDSDSDNNVVKTEGYENFDDDSELVENLTYSPTCYGFSERQCVNVPECEWTITDGYGACRPRSNWWGPLFGGGLYNYWNDYWSPYRWYWPDYSYYNYPNYNYYYPGWRRGRHFRRYRKGRHSSRRSGRRSFRRGRGRRMGGLRRGPMRAGLGRVGRVSGGMRRGGMRRGGGRARSGRRGGGRRR